MTPSTIRRELLLYKCSSFAIRQFGMQGQSDVELKQETERDRQTKILSALFRSSKAENPSTEKLSIWKIDKYSSFIHLSMGGSPLCTDNIVSVDPHFFWSTINYN